MISFLVPHGRTMRATRGLPGVSLGGLPGAYLDETAPSAALHGLPGAYLDETAPSAALHAAAMAGLRGLPGVGLGADELLDHDRVPFRSTPVFLRLVNSLNRAADYAAGGFHVCVDRGLSGGCKDPFTIHASGTKGVTCKQPMNRPDARAAWSAAASAYKDAFFSTTDLSTTGRQPLATVKAMLGAANALADKAFAIEGIAPPRDPGPSAPGEPPRSGEAPLAYQDRFSVGQKVAMAGGLGLAAFGMVGLFSAWMKKRGSRYM